MEPLTLSYGIDTSAEERHVNFLSAFSGTVPSKVAGDYINGNITAPEELIKSTTNNQFFGSLSSTVNTKLG